MKNAGTTQRSAGLVLVLVLAASSVSTAHAQDDGPRLQWRESWNRPAPYDWITTGVLLGATTALYFTRETEDGFWLRQNRFDEFGVNAFAAPTPRGRRVAAILSDITRILALTPPLVDMGIAASVDLTVAGRMSGAWGLSMSSMAFLATGAKYLMRRERPLGRRCEGAQDDPYCEDGGRFRSFPSGHTAMAFAGASLTCTFHQRLPIFGNRRADIAACGTSLAVATLTGVLRMIANRHYISDVLVGALIGILSGWVIPTAMYFGFDRR